MYLVKEIADLMGVSDTLIRMNIKELGLTYAEESAGGRFRKITNNDVIVLFNHITSKWKEGRKEKARLNLENAGIVFNECESSNVENNSSESEIELLKAIIEDLKADKQRLEKQVDDLTVLLNQQQLLNLQTQKQLESSYVKKSWWQKIFS